MAAVCQTVTHLWLSLIKLQVSEQNYGYFIFVYFLENVQSKLVLHTGTANLGKLVQHIHAAKFKVNYKTVMQIKGNH